MSTNAVKSRPKPRQRPVNGSAMKSAHVEQSLAEKHPSSDAEPSSAQASWRSKTFQLRFFELLTVFLFVVVAWTTVVYSCTTLIPLVAQSLAKLSGLTTGAPFDALIATWVAPLVFVLALMVWAEILVIKKAWQYAGIARRKAAQWPLMQPYKPRSESSDRAGKKRWFGKSKSDDSAGS